MAIIAISGRIGSGKDTVGKIILLLTNLVDISTENIKCHYEHYNEANMGGKSNWQIKKFAYKVKQVASMLTGIPVEDFEKEEVKNSYLPDCWNKEVDVYRGMPPFESYQGTDIKPYKVRELLQQIGTDAIRDVVHPDAWANALMSEYKQNDDFEEDSNWIITDCRFPNEAKAIKDRGGIIIRVIKESGNVLIDNDTYAITDHLHSSETSLDYYPFDYTISAKQGDIESLIKQVKNILIKEKII